MKLIGTRTDILMRIDKLRRAEQNGRRRAFNKFGAFVRTTARRSITSAKSIQYGANAKPRNRTGALRNNIFFVYDDNQDMVVIGPVLLPKKVNSAAMHEHGGIHPVNGVDYAARPYMKPAFDREIEKSVETIFEGYIT